MQIFCYWDNKNFILSDHPQNTPFLSRILKSLTLYVIWSYYKRAISKGRKNSEQRKQRAAPWRFIKKKKNDPRGEMLFIIPAPIESKQGRIQQKIGGN